MATAIDYVTKPLNECDRFLKATSKARLATKIAPLIVAWRTQMGMETSKSFSNFSRLSKNTKSVLTAARLPGVISRLVNNVSVLTGLRKNTRSTTAVSFASMGDFTALIGDASDVTTLFHKEGVLTLSKKAVTVLKQISGPALTVGMICKGYGEVDRLVTIIKDGKPNTTTRITATVLSIATTVAFLALGIFSMLATLFGVAIAPVAFLAASTATVVSSIAGYIHGRLT